MSRSFAIITCSDSRTIETDEAGGALSKRLTQFGHSVVLHEVILDDKQVIVNRLIYAVDTVGPDIILTCGGTGFSRRDVTPEATIAIADRLAPGIAEAIRSQSMLVTRRAMLSRGVAALRGNTLIVNLPGSTKAALESFSFIEDQLEHGIDMLHGQGH